MKALKEMVIAYFTMPEIYNQLIKDEMNFKLFIASIQATHLDKLDVNLWQEIKKEFKKPEAKKPIKKKLLLPGPMGLRVK